MKSDWYVLNRWSGHFLFVEAPSAEEAARKALELFTEFQDPDQLMDAELVVVNSNNVFNAAQVFPVKAEMKFSI